MAKHSSDKSNRSHDYSSKQQPYSSSSTGRASRNRRNVEEPQQVSSRSKFSSNGTQLRFTVLIILAIALVLTCIAFFSTNWLEVERRYYGSKFRKLGLWRMCFNSFSAPDDFQFKKFYVGCRWVFAEEYKPIRKFILPRFLLVVLVCAGIIAVQQCFIIEREDYALRALSIASLISATSCTSAVTIFALYGNEDDWMPDSDHNYLSWSFAAALIGSLLLWIAALLFYIEMKLIKRRELNK